MKKFSFKKYLIILLATVVTLTSNSLTFVYAENEEETPIEQEETTLVEEEIIPEEEIVEEEKIEEVEETKEDEPLETAAPILEGQEESEETPIPVVEEEPEVIKEEPIVIEEEVKEEVDVEEDIEEEEIVEEYIPQEVHQEVTVGDIHVYASYIEDAFAEPVTLKAEKIVKNTKDYNAVAQSVHELDKKNQYEYAIAIVLDIHFDNAKGVELEPTKNIEIQIQTNQIKNLNEDKVKLVHITNDGDAEIISKDVEMDKKAGEIDFVSDAFSPYGIVTKEPIKNGWVGKAYYKNNQYLKGYQCITVSGKKAWYYFDEKTGNYITGWKTLSDGRRVYYNTNGQMAFGQRKIGNYYYWFDIKTGNMAKNQIVNIPKAYNNNQAKTCYYDKNGHMRYGQVQIGKYYYYFSEGSGAMVKGWKDLPYQVKRVYYDKNGRMVYGKVKIGGKWYNFDKKSGKLLNYKMNGFYTLAGKTYHITNNKLDKGQKKIGKYWYNFNSKGEMIKGWLDIKSQKKRVYYDKNGRMVTGYVKIDGYWYFFNTSSGAMYKGWKDIPSKKMRVYYDEKGHLTYGTKKINGTEYFFNKSTGALEKQGKRKVQVTFSNNKATVKVIYRTKLNNKNGATYGLDLDTNQQVYGQREIDNYWYYFDEKTGIMLKNTWKYIASQDKSVYYDANGRMLKGDHKVISGCLWNFDKNSGKATSLSANGMCENPKNLTYQPQTTQASIKDYTYTRPGLIYTTKAGVYTAVKEAILKDDTNYSYINFVIPWDKKKDIFDFILEIKTTIQNDKVIKEKLNDNNISSALAIGIDNDYKAYTLKNGNAYGTIYVKTSERYNISRNQIISELNTLYTKNNVFKKNDVEKVKFLYNWFAANIQYDNAELKLTGKEALIENSYKRVWVERKGICESEAKLFRLMAETLGLKCDLVWNATHMWNTVEINGKIYMVDVSWAKKNDGNRYLLKGYTSQWTSDSKHIITGGVAISKISKKNY